MRLTDEFREVAWRDMNAQERAASEAEAKSWRQADDRWEAAAQADADRANAIERARDAYDMDLDYDDDPGWGAEDRERAMCDPDLANVERAK